MTSYRPPAQNPPKLALIPVSEHPGSSTDLVTLTRTLKPVLQPGTFVFASVPDATSLGDSRVIASIREPEGLSVVISEADAVATGTPILFRCAWITLSVESALESIGLTAAFSQALSDAGVSCNVVAGAHHDHIFVPVDGAAKAMTALAALQASARAGQQPRTT